MSYQPPKLEEVLEFSISDGDGQDEDEYEYELRPDFPKRKLKRNKNVIK
jgi:hypothetical protein